MTDEVMVTDPVTGGRKASRDARFDLLPARALWQVATLYGIGARKYEARNWERGYDWSLSFAALMRHANLFWQGFDTDSENGQPHLAAVVFHALALLEFDGTHPEFDDRPATGAKRVAQDMMSYGKADFVLSFDGSKLGPDALFVADKPAKPHWPPPAPAFCLPKPCVIDKATVNSYYMEPIDGDFQLVRQSDGGGDSVATELDIAELLEG